MTKCCVFHSCTLQSMAHLQQGGSATWNKPIPFVSLLHGYRMGLQGPSRYPNKGKSRVTTFKA